MTLLNAWIVFDHDPRGVILTANIQLNDVSAGFKRQPDIEAAKTTAAAASATTTSTAPAGTGATARTWRRITAKVPLNPI